MTEYIVTYRDTAENLKARNPRIPDDQAGLEIDTGKIKVGNGAQSWNNLPYSVDAVFDAGLKQPLDDQLSALADLVYDGNALKVVRVNASATGFETALAAGGGGPADIDSLTDAISVGVGTNNASYYIGENSGNVSASGVRNTGIGASTLFNITTGDHNTAVGMGAGFFEGTGTHNTFLGYGTDSGAAGLTNATALGNLAVIVASNTMQLGNAAVTDATIGDGTATLHANIKTENTDNTTAPVWKLGDVVVAASTPDATQYIEVELGGVVYKLVIAV